MVQRETIVIVVMVMIAIGVMALGFDTMTGLSTVDKVVDISVSDDAGSLTGTIVFRPTIFLADTELELYLDDAFVSSIALKDWLDNNDVGYTTKNKGGNQVIYSDSSSDIMLSDFGELRPGPGTHSLKIIVTHSDVVEVLEFLIK